MLIDSLPGEESTAELQAAGLRELEQESELAGEQLRQTVKQGEQLLASLQVKHLPILHYDSKVCLAWGTQGLNLDILFQQLILISFLKRGGLNDFLPRMEWTNNELTKSDNSKINYWDLISFLTGISDRQAAPKYNIFTPLMPMVCL